MLAGSTVSCQMRQAAHAMATDVKLARVAKHLDSKLSAQSRKYAYSLFVGLPPDLPSTISLQFKAIFRLALACCAIFLACAAIC